jgi:hypothetical protein
MDVVAQFWESGGSVKGCDGSVGRCGGSVKGCGCSVGGKWWLSEEMRWLSWGKVVAQ